MQYVLDSIGNTKGIQSFGLMTIENLVYPAVVEPNTPFTISYDAKNTSATAQNAFGYIYNFATQQQVPGSSWEAAVDPGESYPLTVNFTGISSTFSGEVRIGHIEGGIDCTGPAGAEGTYTCGDTTYPNAPLKGHRYLCSAGNWADQGVDQTNCPTGGGGGINPLYVMGALAAIVVVGVVFIVMKK